MPTVRTIKRLLDEGHEQLRNAQIENPRLAAEIILRSILKLRKIDLYLENDRDVSSKEEGEYQSKIARKVGREPLQYIVGETEWFGLTIKCDKRALVPRPETEIIVERALELIKEVEQPKVVDIGTGTGCIAIAIAHSREDAKVLATDFSDAALALAGENIESHGMTKRISLLRGDLFEPLGAASSFDLIISNPPYIRESEYESLMPEVRDYKPKPALVAGPDGLDVIRLVIDQAPRFLKVDGYLVLEHGIDHSHFIKELAEQSGQYSQIETIVDYNHYNRGTILKRRAN